MRKNYPRKNDIIRNRQRLLCALFKVAHSMGGPVNRVLIAVCRSIRNNAHNHYLALSTERLNHISLRNGNGCHRWDNKRRTRMRLGRYLMRYTPLRSQITEAQIEAFVNLVMGEFAEDKSFRIVDGSDIRTAYSKGFACSSCMTGDEAEYVQIYADNPDVVKMLLYDDGEHRGRALIWHAGDDTLLDRIYPNSGPHIAKIEQWAWNQGYLVREHHSQATGCRFTTDKARIATSFKVELTADEDGPFPYADSFCFGYFDSCGDLCLSTQRTRNTEFTLLEVDGTHDGMGDRLRCYSCGERIDEDDCFSDMDGDQFCDSCFHDRYSYCESCSTCIPNDDVIELHGRHCNQYVCEDCADSDGFESDVDNLWYRLSSSSDGYQRTEFEDGFECTDDQLGDIDYFVCEGCSFGFRNKEPAHISEDDECYCEDCNPVESEVSSC